MKQLFFLSAIVFGTSMVVTSFKTISNSSKQSGDIQSTSVADQNASVWKLDKTHSNVKFTVTHMVVSEVDGSFKTFDGTIESAKDDFSDAKVNFTVDVATINTDNENRDKHLRSDDFFNAESFPQMKFVGTSMKSLGNNKYQLNGNLTIRDITKPVTFDVSYLGVTTDRGKTKAGFKAKTTINRFDYNLKWDRATEAGSLVVAKEVDININAAFAKAQP